MISKRRQLSLSSPRDCTRFVFSCQARVMLVLGWLLSACVVVGSLSDDSKEYGETYRMRLDVMAKSLEFISSRRGGPVVLWKHGDLSKDIRRKVVGRYFVIYNVTQEDSGQYTSKDRNGVRLWSWNLDVEGKSKTYSRYAGETVSITFKLDPDSCNIYFIPEEIDEDRGTYIVRRGWLDYNMDNTICPGFEQSQPCGIVSMNLDTSCSGRYLVKDNNGNTALTVQLEVESTSSSSSSSSSSTDTSKIGIIAGIVSLSVSCCCCLKRCCCGKSSSKKDGPEIPDGEPAVEYHEYDHEPAGPPSYQLRPEAVALYPAQPSTGPTGPSDPLIHPPPSTTMNPPPAYSEVTTTAATNDAPTVSVPVGLESEPRFELKGLTFSSDPPLNSNTSCGDVYTSDKLNFA